MNPPHSTFVAFILIAVIFSHEACGSITKVSAQLTSHGLNPSFVARRIVNFAHDSLFGGSVGGASISNKSIGHKLESFEVSDGWSVSTCEERLAVIDHTIFENINHGTPQFVNPCVRLGRVWRISLSHYYGERVATMSVDAILHKVDNGIDVPANLRVRGVVAETDSKAA